MYHEGQMSREEFLSEKKQLEEERERLQRRKQELGELDQRRKRNPAEEEYSGGIDDGVSGV